MSKRILLGEEGSISMKEDRIGIPMDGNGKYN
jgi:hypothetical protein